MLSDNPFGQSFAVSQALYQELTAGDNPVPTLQVSSRSDRASPSERSYLICHTTDKGNVIVDPTVAFYTAEALKDRFDGDLIFAGTLEEFFARWDKTLYNGVMRSFFEEYSPRVYVSDGYNEAEHWKLAEFSKGGFLTPIDEKADSSDDRYTHRVNLDRNVLDKQLTKAAVEEKPSVAAPAPSQKEPAYSAFFSGSYRLGGKVDNGNGDMVMFHPTEDEEEEKRTLVRAPG